MPMLNAGSRNRDHFLQGGHRLDAFNDKQTEHWLHPTKGWRRMSVKRSRAALIAAEIKAGMAPYSTRLIAAALRA